jgi:hypothetical protein
MARAARASDPRELVACLEAAVPSLPPGDDERFAGWGVMGLPFSSGDYLALRRFPASSVGPAFSAVWWRDAKDRWTMFTSVDADVSCPRYFGRALTGHEIREIALIWSGPYSLRVRIPEVLDWHVTLGSNAATRMMSTMGAAMPTFMWRHSLSLGLIGRVAPLMLQVGNVSLQGSVPNGQWFQANPRRLWLVTESRAILRGKDLGTPAPLPTQTRLGGLWLPQQGLFFVGEAYLEQRNASRHFVMPPTGENRLPAAD